jgi:hypothetical protein
VISELGDFSIAIDREGLGMDRPESWRPERGMPDAQMFDGMPPDHRHPVGTDHWADIYLELWSVEKASVA